MGKEEMRHIIIESLKNLDIDKIESFSVDSGTYDDGSTYTQINIDYVKGG